MYPRFTRSALALAVGSSIALAACTTDSTSEFRTRNTARVDSCLLVYPVASGTSLAAEVNSACVDTVVDRTQLAFARDAQFEVRPHTDQLTRSLNRIKARSGTGTVLMVEGYKADTPVAFASVWLDPAGGYFVEKQSTIIEVGESDSCMRFVATQLFPSTFVGRTTDNCDGERMIVDLQFGNDHSHFVSRMSDKRDLIEYKPNNKSPESFIYSATLFDNADNPVQKMVVTMDQSSEFSVRYFSYSTPTESQSPLSVTQVVNDPTSEVTIVPPSESSVTTTPASSTSSTSTTSTSTTSTSISPSSTAVVTSTTTTTPGSTTTSSTASPTTVASVASITSQITDVCERIGGAELYPNILDWTDGTRFEILVPSTCVNTLASFEESGDIRDYSYNLAFEAHQDDTSETYVATLDFIDGDFQFHGRLPAGGWTLIIDQLSQFTANDGTTTDMHTVIKQYVSVGVDPDDPFRPCVAADIRLDGRSLSLDCDYTTASVHLVNHMDMWLTPQNELDVTSLNPGWTMGTLLVDQAGHQTRLALVLCATNCDPLPSDVPTELQVTGDDLTIQTSAGECTTPDSEYFALVYLKRSGQNLYIDAGDPQASLYGPDWWVGPVGAYELNDTADTAMVISPLNELDSECVNKHPHVNFIYTLKAIPQVAAPGSTVVQPESPAPISRISHIELAASDSVGRPVVIEDGSQVLVLETSAFPSDTFDRELVSTVEISTDGAQWSIVSPVASIAVPISTSDTALQVRYTFADGSQSVVSKPFVSADDYRDPVALALADTSGTNMWLLIVVVIALGALMAVVVWSRQRRKA